MSTFQETLLEDLRRITAKLEFLPINGGIFKYGATFVLEIVPQRVSQRMCHLKIRLVPRGFAEGFANVLHEIELAATAKLKSRSPTENEVGRALRYRLRAERVPSQGLRGIRILIEQRSIMYEAITNATGAAVVPYLFLNQICRCRQVCLEPRGVVDKSVTVPVPTFTAPITEDPLDDWLLPITHHSTILATTLRTGTHSGFATTLWTKALDSAWHGDQVLQSAALDTLLRDYRAPLRRFLLAKLHHEGITPEQSERCLADFASDESRKRALVTKSISKTERFRDVVKSSLHSFAIEWLSREKLAPAGCPSFHSLTHPSGTGPRVGNSFDTATMVRAAQVSGTTTPQLYATAQFVVDLMQRARSDVQRSSQFVRVFQAGKFQGSIPLTSVIAHKNGVEFCGGLSFAPWSELTLNWEVPGRGSVHCSGVVISCAGNKQTGYHVSFVFTNLSSEGQEKLGLKAPPGIPGELAGSGAADPSLGHLLGETAASLRRLFRGTATASEGLAFRSDLFGAQYEVLSKIGEGGSGEVWLTREKKSEKYVAVKSLRQNRELRELYGLGKKAMLRHPGLIDILRYEESPDGAFLWYSMPLADDLGGQFPVSPERYRPCTLADYLHREGPFPMGKALAIAITLCDVTSYLHSQGFVHRDIKPGNVMRFGGVWKLADIGLLAPIGAAEKTGTWGYIAPEGTGREQADVYAVGMLLYNISTAFNPARFPEFHPQASEQEARLEAIIRRACAGEPAQRYISAQEMLKDLDKLQRDLQRNPGSVVARLKPPPQRQPAQSCEWPLMAWSDVPRSTDYRESGADRLNQLVAKYQQPLRSYLFQEFKDDPLVINNADNLLQAFAAETQLAKGWVEKPTSKSGCFRDFLKNTLRKYAAFGWRRGQPLEQFGRSPSAADSPTNSPSGEPFELVWTREILKEALEQMERDCKDPSHRDPRIRQLWEMLRLRILDPTLKGTKPPPYEELAKHFGLKSPMEATNMLVSAKRMLQRHLQSVTAEYEGSKEAARSELASLADVVSNLAGERE